MQAYFYRSDGSLGFEECPAPTPTADSAVIAVRMTAICGTDLRTRRYGSKSIVPPRIMGHEVVGEIVEIGPGVEGFSAGDRVQVAPAIGCGTCAACRKGHTNLCDNLKTIGFDYDGSFAPSMRIPADAFKSGNVTRLDPEVPDDLAVLAEPTACILNSHTFLHLEQADSVAIFGSGFIGCMHAEIARVRGVKMIMMLEIDPGRRESVSRTVPEAITLDPADPGCNDRIAELTHGAGVDVSIVACSAGAAQTQALTIAAKLGRVSLFGGLPGDAKGFLDSNLIHYKELSVHGVHASTAELNRQALDLLRSGSLRTEAFRGNIFPLADIDRGFDLLDKGAALKVLLRP